MQGSQTPESMFPPALLPAVDFKVSATGEFQGVTGSTAFATRLAAKTEELIRAAVPLGEQAHSLMNAAVDAAPANLAPGMLEAATAENYQLETVMWIGATLSVPELVSSVFPSTACLAKLGRHRGQRTSAAKTLAARRNGRKGGRPRLRLKATS
jgi:hypothetical protein